MVSVKGCQMLWVFEVFRQSEISGFNNDVPIHTYSDAGGHTLQLVMMMTYSYILMGVMLQRHSLTGIRGTLFRIIDRLEWVGDLDYCVRHRHHLRPYRPAIVSHITSTTCPGQSCHAKKAKSTYWSIASSSGTVMNRCTTTGLLSFILLCKFGIHLTRSLVKSPKNSKSGTLMDPLFRLKTIAAGLSLSSSILSSCLTRLVRAMNVPRSCARARCCASRPCVS